MISRSHMRRSRGSLGDDGAPSRIGCPAQETQRPVARYKYGLVALQGQPLEARSFGDRSAVGLVPMKQASTR